MKNTGNSDIDIEVQAYIDEVKSTTSVSESRMKKIQDEMQKDADLQLLLILIPKKLRSEMLKKIHVGDLGIEKHGVPEEVFGDNGPCYDSAEFKQFSEDWGFRHTTSSPRYPKSNGLAERTVQTVKNIIRKSKESGEDPQLGLLAYRSTPMENGYSPAQMLMGRRIRTNLPIRTNLLETNTRQRVVKKKVLSQKKQKHYHDRGTKQLPALEPGSRVRVLSDDGKIWREKGVVIREVANRSFMIQTDRGSDLRRNRSVLLKTNEPLPRPEVEMSTQKLQGETTQQQSGIPVESSTPNTVGDSQPTCITRTGREIIMPQQLIEA
ncbi:PREDICTED: endogenous retrovirus group K member 6 Pol protein-like [Priapulus caudatus]|uniref:Endogenous retrovirus group K member 6 Pol protein-like n=1 Tax=Priapulus caudatus TaxID=37621 RepID=A0ABM1ETT0_PRICU|nr:PREDICTED: endogenous retrovirus group K member 6 Pol protein-like [Priapulus caudatus]